MLADIADLRLDDIGNGTGYVLSIASPINVLDEQDNSMFTMCSSAYDTIAFPVAADPQLMASVPPIDLVLQTEDQWRGEELDHQYCLLWQQERVLVAELSRTESNENYDAINEKLDLVRYRMIVISDQLDHGSDYDDSMA